MLADRYALFARRDSAASWSRKYGSAPARRCGWARGQLSFQCLREHPVALASWQGRCCRGRDGRGERYLLDPEKSLQVKLACPGGLYPCAAFTLRRTEPIPWYGSLAFMTVFMGLSVLVGPFEVVMSNLCPWFEIACPVEQQMMDSGVNAEYLARLLREDYAGEEDGVIVQETPVFERDQPGFLPAGDLGPVTEFGGAEETAPEPVRGITPEEFARAQLCPQGRGAGGPRGGGHPTRRRSLSKTPRVCKRKKGLDTDSVEDVEDAPEAAEEEEGWGIRDWLDASPREREEIEVQLMIDLAQRRLKIDPQDPEALGILAYHRYLQEDLGPPSALLTASSRCFRMMRLATTTRLVFKRLGSTKRKRPLPRGIGARPC